jgi:hypothetical protein
MRKVLQVITQNHNIYYSILIYEKEFFASFLVFYAREFNFNLLNDVDFHHMERGEILMKFHGKIL